MAFLNKGLEIRFKDERTDPVTEQNFLAKGGIVDFVKHLNASKEAIFKRVVSFEDSSATSEVEIAMQWNTGYYEGLHSFANNIATTEGGMHEEGFKKALTNAVNKYGRARGFLKEKDDNLLGEDIREGLTAIISVKLQNPQFEGQTKTKLGNTEMRSMVEKATNEKLGDWLEEHPPEAKQIMAKATAASRARMAAKSARDLTRRKSALEGGGLPGKLADCSSRNPAESEMFIVEGNSAGSSAKDARDPHIQAILPIRGKILNVERARMDKMLKNIEIQALITAIGAGLAEEFDADEGALPPDHHPGRRRRRRLAHPHAAADVLLPPDAAAVRAGLHLRRAAAAVLRGAGQDEDVPEGRGRARRCSSPRTKAASPRSPRLKGLGEMDFEELWETTMDPTQRTLLQVSVEQAAIADEVCSILMGDDVESRRGFIQQNAKDVRFLDI